MKHYGGDYRIAAEAGCGLMTLIALGSCAFIVLIAILGIVGS